MKWDQSRRRKQLSAKCSSKHRFIAKLYLTLQPHGLQPARLLCPPDFSGKNTGVGCHFFLQEIFLTQGLNPGLLHFGRYFTDQATTEGFQLLTVILILEVCGLSKSCRMWDLSFPSRIKSASPAMEGGFLITGPPAVC